MKSHSQIDERGLALARAVAERIDADPGRSGLRRARAVCGRWMQTRSEAVVREWWGILQNPWEFVREVLLDPGEEGRRLRQSSPFCGILTHRERWDIFRAWSRR